MSQEKQEKKDDLETVRILVNALKPFDVTERERIIRWVCEKLDMSLGNVTSLPSQPTNTQSAPILKEGSDIKSFVGQKKPKNGTEFCAVVAYYYQFVATGDKKKGVIGGKDLQDAARKSDRSRFTNTAQALKVAYNSGYLDKVASGKFRLNPVGENLVAMVLPSSGGETKTPRIRKRIQKKRAKK